MNTRPKSKRINLVLSGTGALYPAHAGAVCALLDQGFEFKALAGTSGGAIIASALAGGTTQDRLKRSLIDFNPWPFFFRKMFWPFQRGWGLYSNEACEMMLNRLGGSTTFLKSPIPIHIVATQVVPHYQRVVFNKDTSPDLTLSQATRMSTCLPVLFQAILHKGRTLIDGTFADNLYIEPFEDEFENTIAISLNIRSTAHPRTFYQYLKLNLSMLMTGQGTGIYTPKGLTLIPINIYDYTTPLKFNLSRAARARLFEAGYQAVSKHMQ